MYGLSAGAATTSATGTGLLATTGGPLGHLWVIFAGVTCIFAGIAIKQLVSRPGTHRP